MEKQRARTESPNGFTYENTGICFPVVNNRQGVNSMVLTIQECLKDLCVFNWLSELQGKQTSGKIRVAYRRIKC